MARFGREQAEQAATVVPAIPDTAPGTALAERDGSAPAPISEEVAERIREAVRGIPADDGSGAERIVAQLLDAATIDDLNAPWEGTATRNLAGRRLAIRGITQRPSSFDDGAGVFLVADAVDAKTGEPAVFTTSALSVVIQLCRAWQLGLFPVIAEVVVAERPTGRGYYPIHLRIVAAGSAS
jgi:hypothetical protein